MKKQIGDPLKVKTRTVTTNPGGYSKTIVKTKTIDRPGKQGTVSTTKTRPTIKGVASDVASQIRSSDYDFKEILDNKRADLKNKREQKAANPSPKQQLRQEKRNWKDAGRPRNYTQVSMKIGGSIKKKK